MDLPEWHTVDTWIERFGWTGVAEPHHQESVQVLRYHITGAIKCPCKGCPSRSSCQVECGPFKKYLSTG